MKRQYMQPIVHVIQVCTASLVCTSTAGLSTESQNNDEALARDLDDEWTVFGE